MYSTETPPDPVGEIVILRRCHRRRQVAEPKFFEARQKALLLLTAKNPEYEFCGISRSAPRHHTQNEAGETSMIELGDAAPFQPLRFRRAALPIAHVRSWVDFFIGCEPISLVITSQRDARMRAR